MSAIDTQQDNVRRVRREARLQTVDNTAQLQNLDSFLDEFWCGTKVKPFRFQMIASKIGVRWEWDHGFVSVIFGPDNQWEWYSESDAVEMKTYGIYKRILQYSGDPSFVIDNKPYYSLPEEIETIITLPDLFSKEYDPIISGRNLTVVWVTNRYDGMLSGYCTMDRRIYYFDMIDETDFTQARMFAVYALSWGERIATWMRYHVYHNCPGTLIDGLLRPFMPRPEACRDTFRKNHKIVGYFQN